MPPAIALTPSTRKLSICSISSRNKSSSSKCYSVSTKDAAKNELLRKTKKKRCSGDTEERSVGSSSATTISSTTTMSSSSLFDPRDKRQIDRLDKCFDVSSHGTQKFLNNYLKLKLKEQQRHEDTIFIDQTRIEIKAWKKCYQKAVDNAGVVNKNSVLKEKKRLENIYRIKLLQKNIDSWKEDYRKAVDDAGVKAKRKYKGHIEEMARENELIRAQIDKAHRYAAVIEKEADARSKEYEKTIIALKYGDEVHTKENDNIRKELSDCQNELSTLENNQLQYSADNILTITKEKENALAEKQRLQTRLNELESLVGRLNKKTTNETSQSSHCQTSDRAMSWKEFDSQINSLRGPLDELREELEICQQGRDNFREEIDVLKWRIKSQKATLSLLQSQVEKPRNVFKDWFR